MVCNYQNADCSLRNKIYCVIYHNFRHTFVPWYATSPQPIRRPIGLVSFARSLSGCFYQVLNFVRVAVNARKVNLLAVDRSFNTTDDEHVAVLPVDAKLHEFTVSVSGKAPRISVIDPQGPSLNFAPFFPFHIYLTPGKIKVKVNRYSS